MARPANRARLTPNDRLQRDFGAVQHGIARLSERPHSSPKLTEGRENTIRQMRLINLSLNS
jgi:hypothetical protein